MTNPRAYYNEIDPYAAQWLRNLIAAGHIAPGDVDERSIEDVKPEDLKGYTQCHFFAGVGVWSHALIQAGWPNDRPVWTGSCPCQPFSAAGKGEGFDDERHLWPAWHHLIAERRPETIFGEQVASKDGLSWLDLVQADLEGTDYASAAFDICAAGIGAPHIRQRLWFVAERMGLPDSDRWEPRQLGSASARHGNASIAGGGAGGLEHSELPTGTRQRPVGGASIRDEETARLAGNGMAHRLDGNAGNARMLRGQGSTSSGRMGNASSQPGQWNAGSVSGTKTAGGRSRRENGDDSYRHSDASGSGRLGNSASISGADKHWSHESERQHVGAISGATGRVGTRDRTARDSALTSGNENSTGVRQSVSAGPTNGFWHDADWLGCRDGKWRPVEPGTFPLVNGAPARVGRLRAYGNAIVAPLATAFIQAVMESL